MKTFLKKTILFFVWRDSPVDKFIRWRFDRGPQCYFCKGQGYFYRTQWIDKITALDQDYACYVCDGYGVFPLPFTIKQLKRIGVVQ